ncbi:hypothetical protein E1B28_004053 [Marasmius oreades]|uniref:Uncharacterized protein n=1 Tax=Marasmius oreades TaxID=181124 RepID=A0A9P7UXS7_9AGAR|nr:uncharacterized protein E1B28_004053 [Marasmius oreades]KAG7096636.1 hypothetical protein E1B28_004053 [Marasmius oreades]
MSSSLVRATVRRLGIYSTRHLSSISLPIDSIDFSTAKDSPLSSPSPSHPQTPPLVKKARPSFQEQKLNELSQVLASGTPSEVWSHYVSSTNLLGSTTLPLEIHQEVLRKCTPSFQELRTNSALMVPRDFTSSPHQHEGRLQTVIRNIRTAGTPSITDYHFILAQFAAVGHYSGSMQVFKEMLHMNMSPRGLTYFLCLQAIAHRLTLPEPSVTKSQRTAQARRLLTELMTDMSRRRIPFTSVTVDLCARIMKDAGDTEGFEDVVKLGYGIDMSNPDHPPLEALGMENPTLTMTDSQPLKFFPLSTPGLNTIIDMYGRRRDVSKLVQVFEVLTAPLPVTTNSPSSFDDDDDFGILDRDSSPPMPILVAPSTSPNTTSFAYMVRHICQANHIPLARHYLLLAMNFEETAENDTRVALESRPISEVPAPKVAVNGHMVTSLLGLANRNQRVSLTRWIQSQLSTIVKRKQEALTFYTSFRAMLIAENRYQAKKMSSKDEKAAGEVAVELDLSSPVASIDEDPLSLTYTTEEAFKPLDLDLHIRILKDDIYDLTELQSYTAWLLGKTVERLKNRLGRRVWQGKNIYSVSTGARRTVTPECWDERVVYKLLSEEAKTYNRAKEMDRELDEKRGRTKIRKSWSKKDFFSPN